VGVNQGAATVPLADIHGVARKVGGLALAALLIGCSTAPSASPTQVAAVPSTSPTPVATSSLPASSPSPAPTPTGPAASTPPASADSKYLGAFDVLPASPRAGFEAQIACTGPIGRSDPVAIVNLRPGGDSSVETVLRDYADVKHPRSACTFSNVAIRQLVDPQHVVIEDTGAVDDDQGLFAVVSLPDVRYRWFKLPDASGHHSELITVGEALDRIVWKRVQPNESETDVVYLSTAAATTLLAKLPDNNAGRCGQATDSVQGRYAISGSYFYVLNQPILLEESLLVVKGSDTVLSITPPHGGWAQGQMPVFAVWSPVAPTLYWSQGGDVWRWTPDGGKQRFIADVTWFDPTISADGHYLAYAAPRADGKDLTYLVVLDSDAPLRRIGDGPRGSPRFLNETQLWWRVQSSGRGCTGPQPGPRIYNVTSGSEDGTIVDSILATWPATSADYW
jgi:hypothetical protein